MQNELKNFFRPQQGKEINFCKLCCNDMLLSWQYPCKVCRYKEEHKEVHEEEQYLQLWKDLTGTEYYTVNSKQLDENKEQLDTTTNEINKDDSRPAQEVLDPRTGQPMCFV